MKKHFVFDDQGKLIEVRGYRDDIVVERWEIVYDESERVVGLRPLKPEDVIPESLWEKVRFWRKPKPLSKILSVDFIGLIQYIGLINKINKISEVTTIKNIENIKTVGPHYSAERLYYSDTFSTTDEIIMAEVEGAGQVEYLWFKSPAVTESHNVGMRVYTDDNVAFAWSYYNLALYGYKETSDKMNLLEYAENGLCVLHTTLKFTFSEKLKVTMQPTDASLRILTLEGMVNLSK